MPRKIISASRRSDIPAFYSRWFLRRLEEGYCDWIHPFTGKLARVSLRPEDCLALVFWTRNPEPLLPALRDLDAAGHSYCFQVTLTGYPKALESHNPGLDLSLRRLRELADRVGPQPVTWRYDPIVMSSCTPAAFHLERFAEIADALEGAVQRVTFSFVDFYGKTPGYYYYAWWETAKVLKDGYYPFEKVLFTGDIFKMDSEGDLFFISRKDDVFKIGGEKVSPREVEDVIHALPGIKEAVVIRKEDPVMGSSLVAVLSGEEGLDEERIKLHCMDNLEKYLVPKDVIILDSLPKNPNGKVDRKLLQERYGR